MHSKKILFVCIGNYCRSPVAQYILSSISNKNIIVDSAGISPLIASTMDERSINYLSKIGVEYQIHTPKKISSELIKDADLIIAMDNIVLTDLKRRFSKHLNKFRLFNIVKTNERVQDPYKFKNLNEYNEIMDKINFMTHLWKEKIDAL